MSIPSVPLDEPSAERVTWAFAHIEAVLGDGKVSLSRALWALEL